MKINTTLDGKSISIESEDPDFITKLVDLINATKYIELAIWTTIQNHSTQFTDLESLADTLANELAITLVTNDKVINEFEEKTFHALWIIRDKPECIIRELSEEEIEYLNKRI